MNHSLNQSNSETRRPFTGVWVGPLCGLASAVLYTLTNIALRYCVDLDAYLVSAVKAAPTVLMLAPVIGWLAIRPHQPSGASPLLGSRAAIRKRLPQFLVASFLAQFFGNVAFQKALEYIGLAASVPITLGTLIVGGAVLGAMLLHEPVGRRKILAMITLILAVVVLSLPHESAVTSQPSQSTGESQHNAAAILIGSTWAGVSGFAYSFFGVTMRQTLQTGIPSKILMFLSGLTGTLTLWAYAFASLGFAAIAATTAPQWGIMFTAGVCNFSAFIAITTALRLLPVVAVNLINASQVAMAAIAGVLVFGEPITAQLFVGILLTLAGLIILAKRTRAPIVITD